MCSTAHSLPPPWKASLDKTAIKNEGHVCLLLLQAEAQEQWESGQPFSLNARAPWADKEVALPELTEEQKAYIAQQAEKKEAAAAEDVEAKGPTSFFHGKENEDYQVRHTRVLGEGE